jgi:hypothetical protein
MRRATLKLRVTSFDKPRSDQCSLKFHVYSNFVSELKSLFEATLQYVNFITPQILEKTDVLILCGTEGPPLSNEELAAIKSFINRGGTAILNGFSNWSTYQHYNHGIVSWMGINPIIRSYYQQIRDNYILPNVLPPGPYGEITQVPNVGQTDFIITDNGYANGVQPLAKGIAEGTWSMAFSPRGSSLSGKGQILVVTNFHIFVNRFAMSGGTYEGGGRPFILNLIADAITHSNHRSMSNFKSS